MQKKQESKKKKSRRDNTVPQPGYHMPHPALPSQQNSPQHCRTQPPHPQRAAHPPTGTIPLERPQPIGLAVRGRLNNRGVPRRKHDGQVVGAHDVDLFGREQRVGNGVAGGTGAASGDAVGDGDGDVKNGVVVFAVEAEVLADGDLGGVSGMGVRERGGERTLYTPRGLSRVVGWPSPTRQSGQVKRTCLTVEPGSWSMASLVRVKLRPVV